MEIEDIRLYTLTSGQQGERGAADGESQYWGGGWHNDVEHANPMSMYDADVADRSFWQGPGQDPFAIEIELEDGTVGVAANYGGGRYACDVVDTHLRRFVEGASVFDTERIWEQMYRSQLPADQGGIYYMAMSGIDLALWDAKGKVTGQPVYNLIGGRTHDRIPCYVTTHPSIMEHVADEGFIGVKLAMPWGPADGRSAIGEIVDIVAEARETFDAGTELMLECYMGWDSEFTVRVAERIREYDVKWIEDPLVPDHPEARYAEIKDTVKPIQLAAGNLEFGHRSFHRLLDTGAVDILQPELQWIGGLTEACRIASMAKPHDVPVIPHCAGVYNYHFVAAHTNAPFAEYIMPGDGTTIGPIFEAIEGEPVPEDGAITLPDDPGFGVELDRDRLSPFNGS
jgi:L-rhamnonate dehydratase